MQEINNYIKENDTDNVTLNKLKELGTKLTGEDNVQGETVSEVLDFINNNYSGGGSGSKTTLYCNGDGKYIYKDMNYTNKITLNELNEAYKNGANVYRRDKYLNPICFDPNGENSDGSKYGTLACFDGESETFYFYSSEYKNMPM